MAAAHPVSLVPPCACDATDPTDPPVASPFDPLHTDNLLPATATDVPPGLPATPTWVQQLASPNPSGPLSLVPPPATVSWLPRVRRLALGIHLSRSFKDMPVDGTLDCAINLDSLRARLSRCAAPTCKSRQVPVDGFAPLPHQVRRLWRLQLRQLWQL
jgi:hypothetical protein